eukprot:c32688_g1_i1.p1 GENE.c32688_g1_i1~~c32688_g1_i1.p1  ORF type:complete len:166 (+),score=23.69 c32688_g1_i1:83-580(+)
MTRCLLFGLLVLAIRANPIADQDLDNDYFEEVDELIDDKALTFPTSVTTPAAFCHLWAENLAHPSFVNWPVALANYEKNGPIVTIRIACNSASVQLAAQRVIGGTFSSIATVYFSSNPSLSCANLGTPLASATLDSVMCALASGTAQPAVVQSEITCRARFLNKC